MLNRALSSLVLFLCFQSGNGNLDCPVSVEFSSTINSTYNTEGRYDEYLNAFNDSLIERIRSKKTEAFYQNIVNNVVMFLCDVETASERCVPSDSPLAAKNDMGDCIVAADSLCPQGLCERTSNCYWSAAEDMENRTTRFPAADYSNAQEALYGLDRDSYAGSIVVPVGVTVSASVAFLGNEEVSIGVSNAFLHADGLVDDLRSFLDRSRIPLTNINGIIGYAALDAKLIFDGTEYVTQDALNIASSFLGFYALHSKGLNESNALSGFESALTEFESKVHPIKLDLYDQADTIEGGIDGAIGGLDSFTNQTTDWQDTLYQYEGEEYGFRPTRRVIHAEAYRLLLCPAGFSRTDTGVAPGANAVFNDTNLAVAFNVTDKINFQEELDEGLSQIESINITSSFELVFDPLRDIQGVISSMSDTALAILNQATSSNSISCPFDDVYTKETLLEPWELHRTDDFTPYIIRDGNVTSYDRIGSEDSGTYLAESTIKLDAKHSKPQLWRACSLYVSYVKNTE
ncbi:hypothetical protein QTG54_012644 [Skeletonema marinoi]|uniref:Uncharacterized protein n=1 Tax=Skeletonema marinoi TaxID=267567 RepID=A0AAD8XZK7_9STRA|nr:hypothetical protein QTG54_012644 [Skeletonema marinoi]